jgi:hypothetical protein
MVTKKKTSPKEVEMHKFTCVSCGKVNFDMNLYFKDIPSTKCMWCSKYPKAKVR